MSDNDDPAFAEPLPPVEFLAQAARANGFEDWFAVPAFIQTPLNRRIIVEARARWPMGSIASTMSRGLSARKTGAPISQPAIMISRSVRLSPR